MDGLQMREGWKDEWKERERTDRKSRITTEQTRRTRGERGKAERSDTAEGGGCLLADDEADQYFTCVTVSQQQTVTTRAASVLKSSKLQPHVIISPV